MRTFCVRTLGCKVNHYESEQIATLLRSRGLVQVDDADLADLRVINTCSVTVQAASKSRQTVRRLARPRRTSAATSVAIAPERQATHLRLSLPVLGNELHGDVVGGPELNPDGDSVQGAPCDAIDEPNTDDSSRPRRRVIVTGCWATSDSREAGDIPGVSAVLTHHDDLASDIDRLLSLWLHGERYGEEQFGEVQPPAGAVELNSSGQVLDQRPDLKSRPGATGDDGWTTQPGTPVARFVAGSKAQVEEPVKEKNSKNARLLSFAQMGVDMLGGVNSPLTTRGAPTLPLLDHHQDSHQRAFLKVQDGCDAHCTYCIIPKLRPSLWSKPIEDLVEEAQRLVSAGHVELVLTGIFLGAYGRPTALRRRRSSVSQTPLARLVETLCTRVCGLRRLRLSSLEPGDLTRDLLSVLRSHPQVVPHFHLPLQSGSDHLLRRMNRQYTRGEFLEMARDVKNAFDRPAITTDIIVGFPGETDGEFARTLDVVDRVGFLHIHAFPFSPRPGTAAARWKKDFIRGPVVNERIETLKQKALDFGLAYRRQFVGDTVELLVERQEDRAGTLRHGRCERYFDVHFESDEARAGNLVRVRIDRVTSHRTLGTLIDIAGRCP